MPFDLINWKIEAQWLLTWYPRFKTANLKEVKMRGGAESISTKDVAPSSHQFHHHIINVGQGGDDGEPLARDNLVSATIDLTFAPERGQFFEIEVQVEIGPTANARAQTRYLRLPPDTRAPFMINVYASGEDAVIRDTGAVFQGVFVTGHPLLSDVFGPIIRQDSGFPSR